MAVTKFIPISSAIEEYISLTDDRGSIDRPYIKKLANTVVNKLTFEDQLIHKVALLDVKDNIVDLPKNIRSIVQVAYRDNTEKKVKRTQIVEWIQKTNSDCDLKISLDCPKCSSPGGCNCEDEEIIMDVDRDYLMTHPELFYGHLKWYYRHGGLTNTNIPISPYYPEFFLIKYARSTMFGADYHIKGCLNLDSRLLINNTVNYIVEDLNYLRLNVKDGQVLVAYLAYKVDEEGYRYIPDQEDLIEAIKWYIEEMMTYRKYKRTRDKSYLQDSKAAKVEKLEAMGRAREKLRMMDFENFWSFVENNWSKNFSYDSWREEFNAHRRDRYSSDMDRLTTHRYR